MATSRSSPRAKRAAAARSKQPLVSVIIGTHNDGPYLPRCVAAIQAQTYAHFECIIVDDASTDSAPEFLNSVRDPRFRIIRSDTNINISRGRNLAIARARGKYVFITDGDCDPSPTWIEAGVRVLENGVYCAEGKVVYVSNGFKPLFSDRVVDNHEGGLYLGANLFGCRDAFANYPFDSATDGQEDRDWAMRIHAKTGSFPTWVPDAVMFHQRKRWGIRQYLRESTRVEKKIRIMKRYGDRWEGRTRVLYFGRLALLLFPPLMLIMVLNGRVRTWQDVRLLPFSWVRALYERLLIWRTAIRERFFVI